MPLGLFGVNWSSKFLVLEDILILLSWVSKWSSVNFMEASHNVGDDIKWDQLYKLEFMPCESICWETLEVEYIIIYEVKY